MSGLAGGEYASKGVEQLVRERKCPAYILPTRNILGRLVTPPVHPPHQQHPRQVSHPAYTSHQQHPWQVSYPAYTLSRVRVILWFIRTYKGLEDYYITRILLMS